MERGQYADEKSERATTLIARNCLVQAPALQVALQSARIKALRFALLAARSQPCIGRHTSPTVAILGINIAKAGIIHESPGGH